jgi:ABC-2 type transport system permease protein
MFTLNILPPALERALYYTPFPYQLYFPVSIYMGKTTGAALAQGLAIQCFWAMATYAFARLAWNQGIKKYAAAGG